MNCTGDLVDILTASTLRANGLQIELLTRNRDSMRDEKHDTATRVSRKVLIIRVIVTYDQSDMNLELNDHFSGVIDPSIVWRSSLIKYSLR